MVKELKNNTELYAIIPAAGKSTRYKKSNKLFDGIDEDLSVIEPSLVILSSLGVVNKIIVWYDESSKDFSKLIDSFGKLKNIITESLDNNDINTPHFKTEFVKGGITRQETVFNSLEYVKNIKINTDNLWILVHDAARPCAISFDFLEFINKTIECNTASVMGLPISDTIKKVDKDFNLIETVSRENMWVAQTPQMFKFDIIYKSLKHCIDNNIYVTDESQALEILGYNCRMHMGRPHNFKITRKSDLSFARCIHNHIADYLFLDEED